MSKRYIERERFFLETLLLCDRLGAEIKFSHNTLENALRSASAEYKSRLADTLQKYGGLLASYSDTDSESLRNAIPQGYLKNAEYDLLLSFFGSLGRADAENELKLIEGFRSAFNGFYEEAATEKRRYGGLYTKLGFLTGVVISILII